MRLMCRSAEFEELTACSALLGGSNVYSMAVRKEVVPVLQRYWRQGSLITTVFEDLDKREIVGLSIEVFIRDTFLEEIRVFPKPYLREELIRRELAGQSVVLSMAEAQVENASNGLNLFFINDPLPLHTLSADEFRAIDVQWGEILYDYRACNLKTITWECYSEQSLEMGLSCGMKQIAYPAQHDGTAARVHLTSITREQALSQYGTHVSQMFIYAPARFQFTGGQQELLRRALMGETDEALSEGLYLSLSAIKKRWLAIYDRVRAIDPYLLPDDDTGRQTRGTEKRRFLLHYLRTHPEELHPINALRA
ncbi:MAG: hypothetical protein JNJ61_13880 [Anaerolineae bacterium]|jgi:hypothetical protein|nr:hypothetical protein [Anaerolineae bacterium]